MGTRQLIDNIMKLRNTNKNKKNNLIIKKIKKKNSDEFLEWMDTKKSKYYKMAWAYLYNHYDIEDVFQITTMKVYENIHQLKEEKYFETWVTSIFLNECKNMIRKKKREVILAEFEGLEVEKVTYQENFNIELEEELNTLEDIHKEVIILKYMSGYSQEEISKILGIPVGTVKSRIYRGLKILRKVMDKEV